MLTLAGGAGEGSESLEYKTFTRDTSLSATKTVRLYRLRGSDPSDNIQYSPLLRIVQHVRTNTDPTTQAYIMSAKGLPAEEKIELLLQVLATLDDFKPNYGKLAQRMGINTSSNAQRKFKSIVEADKKFALLSEKNSTKVIDLVVGEDADNNNATPAKTPKSRKRTKKTGDGGEEDTPTKRSKKTKSEEKVEEAEEHDEGAGDEAADGGEAKEEAIGSD